MAPVTLHFLPVATSNARRTKRETELIDAEAKSHARASSFAQSQNARSKTLIRENSGSRSVLRPKTNPNKNESVSQTRWRLNRKVNNSVPLTIGDSNGCDPFVSLPNVAGSLDYKLFHFLMSYVPSRFYGTKPWAAYDVLRDSVMPEILTGKAYMSIATYVGASIVNTLQPGPQFTEQWMLQRQAENYQLLRQLIKNQQKYPWDWAITCVAVTGYADAMAGLAVRSRMHTKAGLEMLKDVRNIQKMRLSSGSIAFKAFLQTGVPMILSTRVVLETTMHKTYQNLQRFEAFTRLMRNSRCFLSHCSQHHQSPPRPSSIGQTAKQNEQCEYWKSRQFALGPTTAMGRLLSPKFPDKMPVSDERMLIATTYLLNGILCNLQSGNTTAESFLRDVGDIMINSVDENVDLSSPPRFAMQNCIHIVIACADKHGLWFYDSLRNGGLPLPAARTWEALDFVEIMMLTRSEKRRRITDTMRRWLSWDEEGVEEIEPLLKNERERKAFKNEIVANWEASPERGKDRVEDHQP